MSITALLESNQPIIAIERCLAVLTTLRGRPDWTAARRWYWAWIVVILASTPGLESPA